MTRTPDWLDKVLSYDDLSPEERAEVDAILEENDAARALLARVRAIEENPGPAGSLPEMDDAALAADDPEAAASLQRLQQRVRFDAVGKKGRSDAAGREPSRVRSLIPYLLPVAIAAVLLLTLGSPLDEDLPGSLTGFTVQRSGATRGSATDDSTWRTGDAFVLHCELDRPSFVVLVHVDPGGNVAILDPDGGEGPVARHDAGSVQFPSAGDEWFLEGNPGPETFLVASIDAASERDLSSGRWLRELRADADPTPGEPRADVVARVIRTLTTHFDAVEQTDLVHTAEER